MHAFELGRDVHDMNLVAQKLSWEIGIVILLCVVVFIGLHMFRRAFGAPVREIEGEPPPPAAKRLERYELGARLYHWGNSVILVLLIWSGAAFFFPGLIFPLASYVGVSWLLAHEILAGIFIVFVILHILSAIFRTGLRQMWFGRGDGRDLARRIRYYSGGSAALSKYAKFDIIQKIYHALLAIFALVMIVTGVSLFLSSEVFMTLNPDWMRWQRILHDIFAFLFAAVIIGHIYLRLIRSRWPTLAAMVTGEISDEDFEREHDWRRWQPSVTESRTQSLGAAATVHSPENKNGDEND